MPNPSSCFFEGDMTPEELVMVDRFVKVAQNPEVLMPDAQIHLCAFARLVVQMRPALNREQWSVLFATGGLLAAQAVREVDAGRLAEAFIAQAINNRAEGE